MSKEKRYLRVYDQLNKLLNKTDDPIARMATIIAVLHHKMTGFFWTGFYILREDKLIVGPYQGPLACQVLETNKGVCWAGIKKQDVIIVPDVSRFPDHISCDSRSNSEIVIPVRDTEDHIRAVLDVDSTNYDHFDEIDAVQMERIASLVYKPV